MSGWSHSNELFAYLESVLVLFCVDHLQQTFIVSDIDIIGLDVEYGIVTSQGIVETLEASERNGAPDLCFGVLWLEI